MLGDKLLSADDTRALADVAPREELLARLAGAMAAPMVQFAGLLQALPRNFAYGLAALIEQRVAGPRRQRRWNRPKHPPRSDSTDPDRSGSRFRGSRPGGRGHRRDRGHRRN